MEQVSLDFEDNRRLLMVVGAANENLHVIEKTLGVEIFMRGNHLSIYGSEHDIMCAKTVLTYLYSQLPRMKELQVPDVEAAIRLACTPTLTDDSQQVSVITKRKIVFPKSATQATYIEAMLHHELVFGIGPAGTGKTYLAVAMGISLLLSGKVDKIILTRPAIEAGEKLGFLPGDMREKVDPYLRPLYDALHDMLSPEQVMKHLSLGSIEIAPLAFMRGRTFNNAFIILDEAQNTTPVQMKMFLTRLGPHSQIVVTGDLTQVDLPRNITSGLKDAVRVLHRVPEIKFVFFKEEDVVRHPLVVKIVHAYEHQQ